MTHTENMSKKTEMTPHIPIAEKMAVMEKRMLEINNTITELKKGFVSQQMQDLNTVYSVDNAETNKILNNLSKKMDDNQETMLHIAGDIQSQVCGLGLKLTEIKTQLNKLIKRELLRH